MSLRIFVVCSKERDGTSCVARHYDALFPSPSKDDGASGTYLLPRDRTGSPSAVQALSVAGQVFDAFRRLLTVNIAMVIPRAA